MNISLLEQYKSTTLNKLQSDLNLSNVMQVPRVEKVVLNMGVGKALTDKKVLEHAVVDMQAISGQKPIITQARKSIAGFKVREGWNIGCKLHYVTKKCGIF